jgi:hypothetical protein
VQIYSSIWLKLAFLTASFGLISAASGDQPMTPDIAAQLTVAMNKAVAIAHQPGQTKALAESFYEDDLTITGEGFDKFYPNLPSFMDTLAEVTKNPTCNLRLIGKPETSGRLAVSWFAEHCDTYKDMPAEDYRILYVWRKGQKGWRVTMESFSRGKFELAP